MDRAHAQAQETRRRNREARQQHEADRRKDMELIVSMLRRIIADPTTAPREKLDAIDRLSTILGYPTPRWNDDTLVKDFAKRLKAFQSE